MKYIILFASIFLSSFAFLGCADKAPEPTGLPGDNLDLFAVLNLFKSSASIEAFEKSLNDKSNQVNNLDLNGDGKVDYISVVDNMDSIAHSITLRVAVAPDEFQDVAVIEIEKTGDNVAGVQVIGDEAIYGKDVVIEPQKENNEAGFIYVTEPIEVNVWTWPAVAYVYQPDYVVYASPYHYDYYPSYWVAWEPVSYEIYSPLVFKNNGQYVSYNKRRFKHADEIYFTNYHSSVFVMGRMKNGDFKGGKQERYKGHDFPKAKEEKDKHENATSGQNGKDEHHDGGKKNGDDKKGNEQKGGNDKKVQDHSQKKSSGSSQKKSESKSSGSHDKKSGGSSKRIGGKHK